MRWFISSVFCFLSTILSADEIAFQLTCKVNHQSVTMLEEGKTQVYSGISDSFETGEDLHFDVEVGDSKIFVELVDKEREKTVTNFFAYKHEVSYAQSENGETLAAESGLPGNITQILEFSRDQIKVDRKIDELAFHRYYKSDYQGMYTLFDSKALYTHVVGMDCRTTKGNLDQVFAKYK